MMNGAAMNCRQDQVLRSLHRDALGLQGAGYHLQMNNPCEQNFPPQHSKAINPQSDHFVIDGSPQYLQSIPSVDTTKPTREVFDPRSQVRWAQTRKPIDLPVPQFEIDMNCVTHPNTTDNTFPNQNHNLDLDTRIDLLIKSKALAGMHPIFSELDDSADDSDDYILSGHKFNSCTRKKYRPPSPVEAVSFPTNFDPDKPLSRPPSPFLSKSKYLFWFNKAIELKEQAKAQEQELIEKATKKLLHDNISFVNQNNTSSDNHDYSEKSTKENKPFINCLLNELSKEMKELIKQQFINDVLESTITNTLECWWDKEQSKEEHKHPLTGSQKLNSPFHEQKNKILNDNLKSHTSQKDEPEWVMSATLKPSCDKSSNHEESLLHFEENNISNKNEGICSKPDDKISSDFLPANKSTTSTDGDVLVQSLTSISTKINSYPLFGNGDKVASLDDKLEEKNSEAVTKTNKEMCTTLTEINSQELINNKENSQDVQLRTEMSTILPRNKEGLNAVEDSSSTSKCQKESSTSSTITETSVESNILLPHIEYTVSTATKPSTENVAASNGNKMNFTEHSNTSSLSTICDEQRVYLESKEEYKENRNETSLDPHYNKNEEICVRSSCINEDVGLVTEEKSLDIKHSDSNTNAHEEAKCVSENSLTNIDAQIHEDSDNKFDKS